MPRRRGERSAGLQSAFGTRIWTRKLRVMEAATNIARRVPARSTMRITTTRTATRMIRVTSLSTSSRKKIRGITIRRNTSRSMMRKRARRKRSTKKLATMARSIMVRMVRRMPSLAKKASIKRVTVRKENTAFLRRTNTRRSMIFMTNITRMEEARNMVVGMKNTRARRVAMKRKDIYIRDITRVIMVRKRNAREVIIITRKKATNQQRDTIAIMSMMKNTAIKKDIRQGINGQNQIIIETRQNLLLCNRRMCFTYVRFIENFADKLRLYNWSNIECRLCRVRRIYWEDLC